MTEYTPVEAFIALVKPLVSCPATSAKLHEVVLSVVPTNTLNVPPAPVNPDTDPSLSAESVCELFVKNAVILSVPDLTPKIVTESEAFNVPPEPGSPSNNCTVTFTVLSAAGSLVIVVVTAPLAVALALSTKVVPLVTLAIVVPSGTEPEITL